MKDPSLINLKSVLTGHLMCDIRVCWCWGGGCGTELELKMPLMDYYVGVLLGEGAEFPFLWNYAVDTSST